MTHALSESMTLAATVLLMMLSVSAHAEQFIGKNIKELIAKYGQPYEVEDEDDGSRVYIFKTMSRQLFYRQTLGTVWRDAFGREGPKTQDIPLGTRGGCTPSVTAKKQGNEWIVSDDRFAQHPLCMGK